MTSSAAWTGVTIAATPAASTAKLELVLMTTSLSGQ
jgi:hypothetical protein